MIKRTLLLSTMLVLALTMGCHQRHVTTVQKYMAGGAVVGAGVGAIIGAHQGEAGAGALIGAVTGATVGGLAGAYQECKEIDDLKDEIKKLQDQNADSTKQLAAANARIKDLEDQLAKLKAMQLERITIAADVLFRPGKAILSDQGKTALDGAITRIKSEFAGKFIMVEGHTDAQPIKYSGWKDNWELGGARSLAVLRYLEKKGIDPAMLSGATFSKYQPLATNDTVEGRKENRRAVIVIYSGWPKAAK